MKKNSKQIKFLNFIENLRVSDEVYEESFRSLERISKITNKDWMLNHPNR